MTTHGRTRAHSTSWGPWAITAPTMSAAGVNSAQAAHCCRPTGVASVSYYVRRNCGSRRNNVTAQCVSDIKQAISSLELPGSARCIITATIAPSKRVIVRTHGRCWPCGPATFREKPACAVPAAGTGGRIRAAPPGGGGDNSPRRLHRKYVFRAAIRAFCGSRRGNRRILDSRVAHLVMHRVRTGN